MRVLKVTVLLILALVVLVLGIAAFLPKDFRVECSIEIDAPADVVFDQVNSLRKWGAWSASSSPDSDSDSDSDSVSVSASASASVSVSVSDRDREGERVRATGTGTTRFRSTPPSALRRARRTQLPRHRYARVRGRASVGATRSPSLASRARASSFRSSRREIPGVRSLAIAPRRPPATNPAVRSRRARAAPRARCVRRCESRVLLASTRRALRRGARARVYWTSRSGSRTQ